MQSYVMHLMNQEWKPRWFDLDSGNDILLDQVAHMLDVNSAVHSKDFH